MHLQSVLQSTGAEQKLAAGLVAVHLTEEGRPLFASRQLQCSSSFGRCLPVTEFTSKVESGVMSELYVTRSTLELKVPCSPNCSV